MRVVVVGRDAPLWLAAGALRRGLGATAQVEAVELPTGLSTAAVYATVPALEALHGRLGLDEAALLRATGGVFSLGRQVSHAATGSFFLPWGSHGAPVEGQGFFPFWVKARRYGLGARLQDFSLTAAAALQGRMMLPDDDTGAFGRTDYGYHLPARAYLGVLTGLASRLGIGTHRTGEIGVERDGEAGAIAAVSLDGGRRVAGDLFVDATGDGALIGALGVRWEDWSGLFPGNRRLTARGPAFRSVPPYADMRIDSSGWLAMHPTRGDTRIEQVHAADLLSDADALRQAERAAGMPLADAAVEAVAPGRRQAAWQANCVAIGPAACVLDPAFGVDLHAAQLGIVHLLSLFPATAHHAAERDEYNRIVRSAFERLRDVGLALAALAPWPGAFWDRARAAPVPEALAHKIATFRARGEVAPMEDEFFQADSWQALFTGLGVEPESWSPVIDRTSPDTMKAAFRGMLGFIKDKVLEQPTHDRYLADFVGQRA